MQKFTIEFKEQAIQKALNRGDRPLKLVADELNMKFGTLKGWLKIYRKRSKPLSSKFTQTSRPQDWSISDKLLALQKTYDLSEQALSEWCRAQGIFAHHLHTWKAEFIKHTPQTDAVVNKELRTQAEEIKRLKREIARKDKALAEAAALLILQKKFNALFEDEDI